LIRSQVTFSNARAFCRAALLLFALAFWSADALAQSAAAEPSPASPNSSKTVSPAAESSTGIKASVSETLIDASIPEDPAVMKMLEPYRAKVAELEVIIGRLEGELRKGGVGAGSLGNFVTDGLRAEASRKLGKPVALTVSNSGGMRKSSIAEGELRVRDIFELLPFENALIKIDLTGEQLLRLLTAVVANRDAQSGAHIIYKFGADNRPELVSATLLGENGKERPIDPKATYFVATIDYLYGLGGGRYAVLREGKNMTPIGITLRDALLNYVRSETAKGRPARGRLDGRFTQVGPTPPKETLPQ
jgi:2',3'-cyclic-nucleotide 2'-phosphodiesterase (5'-nucleotidase family)